VIVAHRMAVLLVGGVVGCGAAAGSEDEESERDTDLPSAYTTASEADSDDEQPAMGPDDAARSALAGLDAFVYSRPSGVVTAFESLAVFEDGCPEQLVDVGEGETRALQWFTAGCTTSAGLQVRGNGRFERYAGSEGERVFSGFVLSADGGTFRLETSDGRFLQFSGYLAVEAATHSGGADGTFGFVGDASADPQTAGASALLDGSIRAQGQMYAGIFPEFRVLAGSGAVSGEALGVARAVSFDELLLVAEACAREPAGTLAVRDEVGFWHDIVFDVATWVEQDEYEWHPELCDGCGSYIAGGMEMGNACVPPDALAALMAWEEVPW
jgi:hypothetical protein